MAIHHGRTEWKFKWRKRRRRRRSRWEEESWVMVQGEEEEEVVENRVRLKSMPLVKGIPTVNLTGRRVDTNPRRTIVLMQQLTSKSHLRSERVG
jgi:hypothetical protein